MFKNQVTIKIQHNNWNKLSAINIQRCILLSLMPRLMRRRIPLGYQRPPEPEQHLLLIEIELLGQHLDEPFL